MASAKGPSIDTLRQLHSAREVALRDPSLYAQIVPGVLPILRHEANPTIDIRRWGAEFLAETFASPALPPEEKQKLSLLVLDLLREYLEVSVEDTGVTKGVVQAAASIYPLLFRHIIHNPGDESTWQKMTAIKSNILRRMDTAPAGVRICCIKFVQRVVQTQTPGLIADPRRPENNEISLALVPRDHPIIPPAKIQAETSGLLDRLLGILQEDTDDPLLVSAMLNSLGSLIRLRPAIANKVIAAVLNFNPLKLAGSSMTPKTKVVVKSLERTTRALLMNVLKKNPDNPLNQRIHAYIDRIHRMRVELFDDTNRKRPAPTEPVDGLDHAKRQRLGAEVPGQGQQSFVAPPLPQGPISYAQLYTLTQDKGMQFDVQAIPLDTVARVLVPLLQNTDEQRLQTAISAVRARYLQLASAQSGAAAIAPTAAQAAPVADDDDDYDPDYQPEDAEQIINKLDQAPPEEYDAAKLPEVALGPFTLPPPPPLTEQEVRDCGKGTVNRVFGMMGALDDPARGKAPKAGFNRLAASTYDRDAWVTILTRLATRASAGLEEGAVKAEGQNRPSESFLGNSIRENLHLYIMEDFRRRIDVAVSWLTEEWYNDRINTQNSEDINPPVLHYRKWALKLMDGFLPYLDAKDKILIRFLSELPAVDAEMLERVKSLARDPERVSLAVNAIFYLVLLRPPVREIGLDALEDLWRNYDGAKPLTSKPLARFRPHVLQDVANGAHTASEAQKA